MSSESKGATALATRVLPDLARFLTFKTYSELRMSFKDNKHWWSFSIVSTNPYKPLDTLRHGTNYSLGKHLRYKRI